MLYIEPKEHKRIILTDTISGNGTIIVMLYRHGHLCLGFSAPESVKIKHVVSNNQTPPSSMQDSTRLHSQEKEQYHNGKETF